MRIVARQIEHRGKYDLSPGLMEREIKQVPSAEIKSRPSVVRV